MSLKDIWTDKIDGFDFVEARHINEIAHSVIENEEDIVELKKSKIKLAPTLDGNEEDKAPSVKAVNEGLVKKIDKTSSAKILEGNEEDKVPSVKAVNEGIAELGGRIARNDKRLTNIEQGIPPELFETDSSVAYTKEIPEKALPFAEISKIGGMTYKDSQTLKSAKVTEVESVGVNLIDLKDAPIAGNYVCDVPIKVTEGKYWLSVFNSDETPDGWSRGTNYSGHLYCDNAPIVENIENGKIVTKEQATRINKARVNINPSAYTGTSKTLVAVLNRGATFQPYRPYFRNTLPIPEAVRPAHGINNEVYDYLDFGEQESVKRVGAVDMGTLNWGYGNYLGTDTKCFYSTDISGAKFHNAYVAPTAICHLYNPTTVNEIAQRGTQGYALFADTGSLIICDNNYTDAASFKAAMQGVMLVYELAEPIVTDISDILPADNFIEVEGGGTITAVNENGFDVPSEITYMLEEETV